MEKILVDNYGDVIAFNTESNSISPKLNDVDCKLHIANADGQIISKHEVIDVKKGEIILTTYTWVDDEPVVKVVVVSDKTAIHDIGEWYAEKLKQRELRRQKSNEAV